MMANPGKVLGTLVAVMAVLAGLAAMQGGLLFAKHETDMLHLIDIVARRAAGDVPHLDYMTPLGIWAMEPFAVLHRAGLGLGQALIWGQIAVAVLILPAVWWVGISRMGNGMAITFGVAVLLLVTGMVFGGTDTKPTLAMHYNRWAWALAFLPLALVILPTRRASANIGAGADGAAIGAAMAALALIKVTYFMAFAPAVVLGLVVRRQFAALGVAAAVGGAVALGMSITFGIGFWQAYADDLLSVARSTVRPAPGAGWAQVVLSPDYAAGTLMAIASVLWVRRADRSDPGGLILAVMLPGAIYVTWQNSENDPLWLILWGIIFAVRFAMSRDVVPAVIAAVALALVAPVAANIAVSPLRQATLPRAVFTPLFPDAPGRDDIYGVAARFDTIMGQAPPSAPVACRLTGGAVGWMRAMAGELDTAGLAGRPVYVADLFNFMWLFGDTPRLTTGAPWFYGGLPGAREAELLIVPKCPIDPDVTEWVVNTKRLTGVAAQAPLYDSALMAVYEIGGE